MADRKCPVHTAPLAGTCDRCGDFTCVACGTTCGPCRERLARPAGDPRAWIRNAADAFRATLIRGVLANALPPWVLIATGVYGFVNESQAGVALPGLVACLLVALLLLSFQVWTNTTAFAVIPGAAAAGRPRFGALALVACVRAFPLAVIPIVDATGAHPIGVVALLPAAWLWFRIALAHPVALVEQVSGPAAIRRSFELTRGKGVLVVVAAFLFFVTMGMAFFVAAALATDFVTHSTSSFGLLVLGAPLVGHADACGRLALYVALAQERSRA